MQGKYACIYGTRTQVIVTVSFVIIIPWILSRTQLLRIMRHNSSKDLETDAYGPDRSRTARPARTTTFKSPRSSGRGPHDTGGPARAWTDRIRAVTAQVPFMHDDPS